MPLLSLWPFTVQQVQEHLDCTHQNAFNYESVGATKDVAANQLQLPQGWLWVKDHTRVKVGSGRRAYDAAKAAVQRWAHFQLDWARVEPRPLVVPGAPVAVQAKTLFMWSVNPLRVVYVADSQDGEKPGSVKRGRRWFWLFPSPLAAPASMPNRLHRWQFAHGCVQGHMLAGEESFRVEWDEGGDDGVWYEVLTFSRPVHPLALLAYPLTRASQARFAADSVSALRAALCTGLVVDDPAG